LLYFSFTFSISIFLIRLFSLASDDSFAGLASASVGDLQIGLIATLFPHLRKLSLADNSLLKDQEFKSLSLLTELRVLNLANTAVREGMRLFVVLFCFLFCIETPSHSIGGLTSISTMSTLWDLSLESCGNVNQNSLKYFTLLRSLHCLDLYQTSVPNNLALFPEAKTLRYTFINIEKKMKHFR
jgi:hypothetical protein